MLLLRKAGASSGNLVLAWSGSIMSSCALRVGSGVVQINNGDTRHRSVLLESNHGDMVLVKISGYISMRMKGYSLVGA